MTDAAPTATPRPIRPPGWERADLPGLPGQVRAPVTRLLTIAAQGPLDEQGAVLHAGDPAAQLALALGNVLAVVEAAGLPPTALAQLRAYTTDLHALSSCLELVVEHLGGPDRAPPTTCVGVADLGDPRVLVVLEGLAAG